MKNKSSGFTLVEMLTVLAVISIMISLAGPALSSLVRSNSVSQAADLAASSAMRARQMAMNTRSPVAMVLTPSSGVAGSKQAILLLVSMRDENGDVKWNPGSPWLQLPAGTQISIYPRNGVSSFYNQSSAGGALTGSLPLQLNGAIISNYGYIVFYPDGSIDSPEMGPTVTLSGPNSTATPDYTVVFQSDSGRSKTISN